MTERPAPPQSSEPRATPGTEGTLASLGQLLLNDDLHALSRYLQDADPHALMELSLQHDIPGLREANHEMLRRLPELQSLRAASLWRSDHHREELELQLYEATKRLASAGRFRWARESAERWLEYAMYCMDLEQCVSRVEPLLQQHAELADGSARICAMAAGIASVAGVRPAAERLWPRALSHPMLDASADEYWSVHMQWAAHELIPCQGDLASAQRLLRRARDHFSGRADVRSLDECHTASMYLAWSLLLAGQAEQAQEALERDLRRFQPGSLYETYLKAFLARTQVALGTIDAAAATLAQLNAIPGNDNGIDLAVIAPARILTAAHRGNASLVASEISRVLEGEFQRPKAHEDRVAWRLEAARAYALLGLTEPALDLLSDAIDICSTKHLPWFEACSRLLRWDLGGRASADDDLRAAVQLGDSHDLLPLFARWDSRLGSAALWTQLATSAQASRFTARCLRVIGPAAVEVLSTDVVEPLRCEPSVEAMVTQLGWVRSTPKLSVDDPRPRIEFRFFGGFSLEIDGKRVAPASWHGRRKARLLLARLALERGAPVRSDQLAEDLWHGVPPSRVSSSLAPLVHTARRVLEPGLKQGSKGSYLHTEGSAYRLVVTAPDTCDVHTFFDLAEDCLRGEGQAAIDAGLRALDASSGDFMATDASEDWLLDVRRQFDEQRDELVVRLAMLYDKLGSECGVLTLLEDVHRRRPTSEEACGWLMRSLAHAGRRSEAVDVFHHHRRALDDLLGISPNAPTRALLTDLLRADVEA